MPMGEAHGAAVEGRNRALEAALAPWAAPHAYLNFVEGPTDTESFFDPWTWDRLRRAKHAYDLDELILSNFPIPPAGS